MTEKVSDFVSIIVLAAGLSTRFGRNKLLEPIGSSTMIEHVVSESLRSKASQVIVVCGHEADRIKRQLKGYRCEFVFNGDYTRGQSFSVRKGLTKVKKPADAVIVLPGDVALGGPHDDRRRHRRIRYVLLPYRDRGLPREFGPSNPLR